MGSASNNDDWNDSNDDDETTKHVQKYQNAQDSDVEEDEMPKNKKKNNKKKNKKNKKKSSKVNEAALRAEKLLKLKEQRQTELLNLGNNLLGDLEVKYAPYLSDEINQIWEDQILEFVEFYEEDYGDKVEDDSLLK